MCHMYHTSNVAAVRNRITAPELILDFSMV